jgi:hypothetical protein
MKIGLLLIATGDRYEQYIQAMLDSAKRFFLPHDPILFTDRLKQYTPVQIPHPHYGFPQATLRRYHTFLTHRELLSGYDFLFYVDVDALFVNPVGKEILADGITATLHFNQHKPDLLEENTQSVAYLEHAEHYFCGGFNGGRSDSYLDMAEAIREGVDYDNANGIMARWHD